MKKRIIIPFLLCALLAALLFVPDYHSYTPQSKTIPCEDTGIILSITTFTGENESEPLVKCLGHTWISIDNRTGHSVYVKDYELKDGEEITVSIWAVSGHFGVFYNLEPAFIRDYGRYRGRQSLSVNIDESQLQTINDYIDRNSKWTLGKNCSYWSIQLWNELVSDEYALNTQTLLYTPKRLQKSIEEYDCAELDRDFSRCGEIFFYRDGSITELKLCS